VVGRGERALQLALVDGAAAVAVGGPERALDLRVRPRREREVSAAAAAVAVPESSRRLRWRRVGAAAPLAVAVPESSRRLRWWRVGAAASLAVPESSRRLRWRRVGATASLAVPATVRRRGGRVGAVAVAVVVSHGGIEEEVAMWRRGSGCCGLSLGPVFSLLSSCGVVSWMVTAVECNQGSRTVMNTASIYAVAVWNLFRQIGRGGVENGYGTRQE
jgi:hypothetical protein